MTELQQQLAEARIANESLLEENRKLKGALAEQSAELEKLRSRYAQLLISTDAAVSEISSLELSASHLIQTAEEPARRDSTDAAELLETLSLARRRLISFTQTVKESEKKVNAAMDACQPSQALRQEVETSFKNVDLGLESCLQPLTLATVPDSNVADRSCAVLRLDPSTQVAVLDQGFLNGVRTGMEFTLMREQAVLARLKVIECRALTCAAILSDGDFNALVPGALLHRAPPVK